MLRSFRWEQSAAGTVKTQYLQLMLRILPALLICTLLLFSSCKIRKKQVLQPGQISVEWTDSLPGDFSFSRNWSYNENVFRNGSGQLVCDGFCEPAILELTDTSGNILPGKEKEYYALFDTSHHYHSIQCEARCDEWDGTNFIDVKRTGYNSFSCHTAMSVSTHCALRMDIRGSKCQADVLLNSIMEDGSKIYIPKSGFIRMHKQLLLQNRLRAEFSFIFGNDEEGKPVYWKGLIDAPVHD